jgi:hypothetical protein
LALATIVAVVFILRGGAPERPAATEDSNSAKPTVSGWDETSTPSTPPPPTNSGGGELIACPTVWDSTKTTQRSGVLRSGNVVVDRVPGWDDEEMWLEFAYDRHFQVHVLYRSGRTSWMADVGVGSLSNESGFVDIRTSAEQVMQCLASSQYYEWFSGRKDLVSEQIKVSGHQAWHLRAEIYVEDETFPQVEGDVTDVVVIDLGPDSDHLGLYTASCTIDDKFTCDAIDKALTTLRVED